MRLTVYFTKAKYGLPVAVANDTLRIICVFVFCVYHAFASVLCSLVVTCWERADLLALVCDVYCIFVTFPCGILCQVWYLIESFPDLCRLSYFYTTSHSTDSNKNSVEHYQEIFTMRIWTKKRYKSACKRVENIANSE